MSYDRSALKGRIIEKFGTLGNFANSIGMTLQMVGYKLNNKSSFTDKNIESWASALDIDRCDYGRFFYALKSHKCENREE